MAVLKCKMCGGTLNIKEGITVCECEYCGSKQTIPNADNEKKMTLFARADRLLRNCEFDKAAMVFEGIVAEFPEEAEAYWGNVLCKYGIEYVDDPENGRKVPTCHRSSFDSLMDDSDFDQVMEYADPIAKKIYREQAKEIESIRKGIVEVSGKELPYDIFICYKETASDGQRTLDSVLAQDVYDVLTEKGYRVFFSRISLEDKLGTEYEPYIFAALNSAKVMLAFGTDYDYYDAVWVKNEWSRFLKLMSKDKSKHLIPCYKNIDAYDIPKEFAKLQAQDMGKVGAVQDLIRGIDKVLRKDGQTKIPQIEPMIQPQLVGGNTASLVRRGYISLEDEVFDEAKEYFNRALDLFAESAEAYLGLFYVEIKVKDDGEARKKYVEGEYAENRFWKRAKQYATGETLIKINCFETERNQRIEKEKIEQEKREQEIVDYQQKLKEYNQICLDNQRMREEELKKIQEECENRKLVCTAKYNENTKSITDAIKAEQNKIHEARSVLARLKVFQKKEKKQQQEIVEAANAKLIYLGTPLEKAYQSYRQELDDIAKENQEILKKARVQIPERFPDPEKPMEPKGG